MKLTHKRKLHLARSMMTQKEIIEKVPPFDCKSWIARKEARTGVKTKPKRSTSSRGSTSTRIIKLKWYQRIWKLLKRWGGRVISLVS